MNTRLHLKENPACKATSIRFFILGKDVEPQVISKLLRITPSRAFGRGDFDETKAGRRAWNFGHWSIVSGDLIESTSTEKHALAILKLLEPKKYVIRRYIRTAKARVGISFWWQAAEHHGGFGLGTETMQRLAKLCSEMHFHFVS